MKLIYQVLCGVLIIANDIGNNQAWVNGVKISQLTKIRESPEEQALQAIENAVEAETEAATQDVA